MSISKEAQRQINADHVERIRSLEQTARHQQILIDAQQQQLVQLSEFISLVTEAIPGELFPSYHLTPGGPTDGIDIQRTAGRARTRRRATQAIRQIKTRWDTPYPRGCTQPTPPRVR